ncbi:DUF1152 domain-containing protein [bacterium]|nr:DUF1152 domain-containing protein [bacterium]
MPNPATPDTSRPYYDESTNTARMPDGAFITPIERTRGEIEATYTALVAPRDWKRGEIRKFEAPEGITDLLDREAAVARMAGINREAFSPTFEAHSQKVISAGSGSYYRARADALKKYLEHAGLEAGNTVLIATTGGGGDPKSVFDFAESLMKRGINIVFSGISLKRRAETTRVGCIPISEYRESDSLTPIEVVPGSDGQLGIIHPFTTRVGPEEGAPEIEGIVLEHLQHRADAYRETYPELQVTGLVADFSRGPEAITKGFLAARDHFRIDRMIFMDVGGDVVANGHETALESEVLDTYALWAAKEIGRAHGGADLIISGLGGDGEISLMEIARQLERIAADDGFISYVGFSFRNRFLDAHLVRAVSGKTETSLTAPHVFADLITGYLPGTYSEDPLRTNLAHTPNGENSPIREYWFREDRVRDTLTQLAEAQRTLLEIAEGRHEEPMKALLGSLDGVWRRSLRRGNRIGDLTAITPGYVILDAEKVAKQSQLVQEVPPRLDFATFSELRVAQGQVVEIVNTV